MFIHIDCKFEMTVQSVWLLYDLEALIELYEESVRCGKSLPPCVAVFYAPSAFVLSEGLWVREVLLASSGEGGRCLSKIRLMISRKKLSTAIRS